MDSLPLAVILISILFSAYFSGMEIAFLSSNKLKIELDKKKGSLAGNINSHFLKNQSRYISTMLVGNNIALVVYGIAMAEMLEPFLLYHLQSELWTFIAQTIISTLLILVTAEFLPKAIFSIEPNKTLNFFAFPGAFFYAILSPLVSFTMFFSMLFFKLFKQEVKEDFLVFGKIDLNHLIREATENSVHYDDVDTEVQILQNALDFSSVKARECMIPRTEIIALDIESTISELKNSFIETGLSRIMIYRDSIDNIIGYTHSFELFKKPQSIKGILLPVCVIPESMPANEILRLMNKQKRTVSVVVDEFGGTSGIVTIEDIIEEIFGDIEDEFDTEELIEKQEDEHSFLLSGRLEIDYLNETYKLNIPESEEYETLGGFVINACESIPSASDIIVIEPFTIEILSVNRNKIETLRLKVSTE
jgi:putative hemolysin